MTVIEKAAGSSPGSLMFHEDGNGSGWGFLADDLGAVEVDVVTVDDTVRKLALPTVDFIKIDVEGSEMAVLLGAENTLSKFKPILIFEVNTFCLWRYGRTFPQDLIQWVRDRYPFTAAIFSDGSDSSLLTSQFSCPFLAPAHSNNLGLFHLCRSQLGHGHSVIIIRCKICGGSTHSGQHQRIHHCLLGRRRLVLGIEIPSLSFLQSGRVI